MDDPVSLNLPPDLAARAAMAEDIPAILELIATCELEEDGVAEVDEGDVSFERHGFEPELDTMLVFDRDELVAWAELYQGRGEADVRPSYRGHGIGAALVTWIETRARELGDDTVGQSKTDANAGARELFLAKGYEPAWVAWIIRIELEVPPRAPEVPPGISIRPFRDSDAVDVHRVIDTAFSEWDERDAGPFEVWASEVLVHPGFTPDLSPLAFDGDELVGVVLAYDFPGPGEGWIKQLATRASHRHRGIAQALLRTAFVGFYEAGRRVAGVSTDSRTGALGLYEKVGMHVVRQYTRYRKHLNP